MTKNKLAGALAAMFCWAALCGCEDSAERAKREFYESYASRMKVAREAAQRDAERQKVRELIAQDREARGKDAPGFAELYQQNAERAAARAARNETPSASRSQSLWIYDLSPEFLRAETFGETLHVTVSAEFNRGWSVYPCVAQRQFVSDLFVQWKQRNSLAHTVKLLNSGGGEIGGFSRLRGYHCGD